MEAQDAVNVSILRSAAVSKTSRSDVKWQRVPIYPSVEAKYSDLFNLKISNEVYFQIYISGSVTSLRLVFDTAALRQIHGSGFNLIFLNQQGFP